MSGTSMASPHVAGAVALYLQANKTASPAQVLAALINNSTASKIANPGTGSPNRLLYTGFLVEPPPSPTTIPNRLVRMIFIRKVGAGTPVQPPTSTPTRTPTPVVCTNAIVDGGMEQVPGGWTHFSSNGFESLRCTLATCGENTVIRTGTAVAWLGGAANEESTLTQTVTVPNGSSPVLSYWYYAGSEEATCGNDFATSYLIAGATQQDLFTHDLCNGNETGGWRNQIVNLSAWAGKSVTIGFRASTNGTFNSNFFIDDVSLYGNNACTASAVVVEESTPMPPVDGTPRPGADGSAPRFAFP
jgi:hypothetical protein